MSFVFDLPFHPTLEYASTITERYGNETYSVYFGMPSIGISDARIQFVEPTIEFLIDTLKVLPAHVKKYVTMNGRYTPLAFYDQKNLKQVTSVFEQLMKDDLLHGILFADFYHLNMLATVSPDVFSQLEAVPSINCYMDNIKKFTAQLVYVNDIGMKLPAKVIFDRSLNHRMDDLADFSQNVRKKFPGMLIEILVNEGCLYQCPFKINHDIMISLVNDVSLSGQEYLRNQEQDNSFNSSKVNEEWGCVKYLDDHPSKFFQIPFIRPEDVHHYDEHVDILKISGKVLQDKTVYNIIEAYVDRCWDGNLLDILDATGSLRNTHYVFNDLIPENFHKMLTSCDKNCMKCIFCDKVAKSTTQRLNPTMRTPDYCPSSST